VFWARGYYVNTVGLDEQKVRQYIKNRETEDMISDKTEIPEPRLMIFDEPFVGLDPKAVFRSGHCSLAVNGGCGGIAARLAAGALTSRLRHKNIITLALSVGFLLGYLYISANIQAYLGELVHNGTELAEAFRRAMPPFYAFSKSGQRAFRPYMERIFALLEQTLCRAQFVNRFGLYARPVR
jgi:hypothetical protein